MPVATERAVAAVLFCVLGVVAIVVFTARRTKPLGQAPTIDFPSAVSQSAKIQLLRDDFEIITDVGVLPPPVVETFREKGGLRLLLANPGARYNPSDFVLDASVPQERLILAGVSKDRCFVHYERGGRGTSYIVEVFELRDGLKPLWSGHCTQPAGSLEKLRSQIASGGCS